LALFPLGWKPDAKTSCLSAAHIGHAHTIDSLILWRKRSLPRLKGDKQPEAAQDAAAEVI